MISLQKAKYIKSLQVKKYRKKHRAFLVEGAKSVLELLNSDFNVEFLACTHTFIDENQQLLSDSNIEIIDTTSKQLESVGTLKTNDAALAVVKMPENKEVEIKGNVILLLDNIQDPGNLGTIIRTADWFGLSTIVLSEDSADVFNSKVLQATMGSFIRVNCIYTDLDSFIGQHEKYNFCAAVMDGEDVHQSAFDKPVAIILGNESSGINKDLIQRADHKISIPKYGGAESLNVAMAAGIILDNVMR